MANDGSEYICPGGTSLDADGNVLPAPNDNSYIRPDGSIVFTGDQSMGGFKLTDVAPAINDNDLVNLSQLLSLFSNLVPIATEFTAGEFIPKNRVVYINTDSKIYKANSSDFTGYNRVIGIIVKDVEENEKVHVIHLGRLDGLSGLTIGTKYFYNTGGALVATPPSVGYTQVVGNAISATSLLVRIQLPITI
jgi:hypothetical protein